MTLRKLGQPERRGRWPRAFAAAAALATVTLTAGCAGLGARRGGGPAVTGPAGGHGAPRPRRPRRRRVDGGAATRPGRP